MKKKVKFPTNSQLLKKKTLYNEKRDPIWIALEREMKEKAEQGIKPYNEKVGKWLKYMRGLLYHYYKTEKRHYIKAKKGAGPAWYFEYSEGQRATLRKLKVCMQHDEVENRPTQTRKAIKELGITLKFTDQMLMDAIFDSFYDPGVLFWNLFVSYYKTSPSEPLPRYDENAMLMMSALVFTDLEDCKRALLKVTEQHPRPKPKPPNKTKRYFQPNVKYGEYLQKLYVPLVSSHPDKIPKTKKPMPLKNKIKLRSAGSYARLAKQDDFLGLRKEKNRMEQPQERVCNYKFWECPSSLRETDPKQAAYLLKMKMFKAKPKPTHLKGKPPLDNIQHYIKGVTYASGRPVFNVETIINLPTGYIPINGGYVRLYTSGEYVLNILGFYRYPKVFDEKCESECNCLSRRQSAVFSYLKESRCGCPHRYDFGHTGKPKRTYFHPPKNYNPFHIDEPKVYNLDDWDDFINKQVKKALDSNGPSVVNSDVTILPSKLKSKELLAEFLAQLSNTTPLMIPHLPNAALLKNLQELVRRQVKGDYSKKKHNDMLLKSKRKWLNLNHIEWFTRAYFIPFTKEQLDTMNFSHRPQLQELSNTLLKKFTTRTRKSWMEFTRIFWNTMKHETYPNKSFLDAFFTYMPVRPIDTYAYNPYSPDLTPKYGAKTCPIERPVVL